MWASGSSKGTRIAFRLLPRNQRVDAYFEITSCLGLNGKLPEERYRMRGADGCWCSLINRRENIVRCGGMESVFCRNRLDSALFLRQRAYVGVVIGEEPDAWK